MPREAKHLILVGLPGAGKTTVGPLVAARLGVAFADFDTLIEQAVGMSVASYFREFGEVAFRAREREVTARFVGADSTVLSPGGGWIMQPDAVGLLRPNSKLVWLQVSPRTAAQRLGGDAASRPLLVGGVERRLAELLETRSAFYGASDAQVDTEALSPQLLAEEVARLAIDWGLGIG